MLQFVTSEAHFPTLPDQGIPFSYQLGKLTSLVTEAEAEDLRGPSHDGKDGAWAYVDFPLAEP